MSVNDDADLPWLTAEKQAIADAVRAGVPYWGSCLGVQLLAASLGASVYPGTQPEVGVLPVTLTGDGRSDPVFAGLPAEFLTLQWHGDTFDLPDGATLLASSPAYPNQAFRVGQTAYGVQFHVEVTEQMAREWAAGPGLRRVRRPRPGCRRHRPPHDRLRRGARADAGRRPAHVRALGRDCSRRPADSRFLALRFAAQEATDFGMNDDAVRRFVELRDQGTAQDGIAQELRLPGEVVEALVKADDAQALAHRIAAGEEPMYPAPEPGQRVFDTRSGSSAVPLAALIVVLLGTIVYALVR